MVQSIQLLGGGTSERWVEPQYTDDWVFSDGQKHTIRIDYTDETFDGHSAYNYYMDNELVKGDTGAYEIEISNYDNDKVTAYRKYTPGHWEDADRNWINGSWGDWKGWHRFAYSSGSTDIGNNNVAYFPPTDDQPARWTIEADDALAFPNEDNPNMLYSFNGPEFSSGCATRTWNNTKPAPAA